MGVMGIMSIYMDPNDNRSYNPNRLRLNKEKSCFVEQIRCGRKLHRRELFEQQQHQHTLLTIESLGGGIDVI